MIEKKTHALLNYEKKLGVVEKMGSKMETTYNYYNGNPVKDMHCQEEKLEVVDALQGDKNVVITQETM